MYLGRADMLCLPVVSGFVPKAAILVGEAEQRRAAPEDALWMGARISPSLRPGYEFNLPFERRGVGSDGGPRR